MIDTIPPVGIVTPSELLETRTDWMPTFGAFLGAFLGAFTAMFLGGSI